MKNFIKIIYLALFLFVLVSCTTKQVMEDNNARFKDINEEYAKVVTVDAVPIVAPNPARERPTDKVRNKITPKTASPAEVKVVEAKPKKIDEGLNKHLPSIEDGEGFVLRRPVVDPYAVGEKIVLGVNYFNVEAGDLSLNVGPFKVVNGRKAYTFSIDVKSTKMFSLFYSVNNHAETFVDYESLLPITYSSESKETSRRKEARAYFDWKKNEATQWEKTLKKDGKEDKKKIIWTIEEYAQNIISALFYLRSFQLSPGKKFAFRVADSGKNYTFHAEVLRREKLKTSIGELNTVVIRPTFELEDQFKQTGENLFWVTDDDRKFIVRIESKIKIGTLVGKVKSIERGQSQN